MKTNETKRKHHVGAGGLLTITARLKEQVRKTEADFFRREAVLGALMPDAPEGVYLRVAQIERNAGIIDADVAAFIINQAVEDLAELRYDADEELDRINRSIAAAERAQGLKEDEYWPRGEAPDDVERLYDAWERRADEIKAVILREYGEETLADLLLADSSGFSERVERGRHRMFGPLPEGLDKEVEGVGGLDK